MRGEFGSFCWVVLSLDLGRTGGAGLTVDLAGAGKVLNAGDWILVKSSGPRVEAVG